MNRKPESFTQKVERLLMRGLHPHHDLARSEHFGIAVEGYAAEDIGEAIDAVKSIAFAIAALDFDEQYAEDAVIGWLCASEHKSLVLRTHDGKGNLFAIYEGHARNYIKPRVDSGSIKRGGMRSLDAKRRLAQLADEGLKNRSLVRIAASLLACPRDRPGNDNVGERARLTPKLRQQVFERDGFKCRRCGHGPPDVLLVVDHVVPVAKGGVSELGNLQTLCRSCNAGKAARPPHAHDRVASVEGDVSC